MLAALLSDLNYSSYFQDRPAIPTCIIIVCYLTSHVHDEEKVEELHLDLCPSVVLSDFERAIICAPELSFPTTDIKRFYYHYCQCLNRKIQRT